MFNGTYRTYRINNSICHDCTRKTKQGNLSRSSFLFFFTSQTMRIRTISLFRLMQRSQFSFHKTVAYLLFSLTYFRSESNEIKTTRSDLYTATLTKDLKTGVLSQTKVLGNLTLYFVANCFRQIGMFVPKVGHCERLVCHINTKNPQQLPRRK